jgi:hypothetical protein
MDKGQLISLVRQYEDAVRAAEGELSRTRERLVEARALLEAERATARALRTTLAAHKERQPISKPASDAPQSVLEAVERAQALYSDALRLLPSAFTSGRESSFPDPDTAWSYLKALGEVGRRRQDRALGRPLGDVFTDLGVDFSAGPADGSRKTPYIFRDGEREVECADQLRKGANPLTCLRIYFTSSEDGGFVIGHAGRQIEIVAPPAPTPPADEVE